jgi:hypothetical protein
MSAHEPMRPAFMRATALARHIGVSRASFYRHWKRRLTPYPAPGERVTLYDVREAEMLIRNGRAR